MDQVRVDRRTIAKSRVNRAPGRVVRIGLGDGRCGYGRQLTGPTVEFYDRSGDPAEPVDLLDIAAEDVAFRIWVVNVRRPSRTAGTWNVPRSGAPSTSKTDCATTSTAARTSGSSHSG